MTDLSPTVTDAISERSKEATFSYLLRFGIPQTPSDVLTLFDSLFMGVLVWAVGDGYATLTEKSMASKEEKEKNAKMVHSILDAAGVNHDDASSHGYI